MEQYSWAVSCKATSMEDGPPYQGSAWVGPLGMSLGILMQIGATFLKKRL